MTNYEIGLTSALCKKPKWVQECLARTMNFDPGETNDLDRMMETISAMVNSRPSSRYFAKDSEPTLIVLLQPAALRALVFTPEDLENLEMQRAVTEFGFNPATLQPIEEGAQ